MARSLEFETDINHRTASGRWPAVAAWSIPCDVPYPHAQAVHGAASVDVWRSRVPGVHADHVTTQLAAALAQVGS